jgi:hypothetical protein
MIALGDVGCKRLFGGVLERDGTMAPARSSAASI